jgi:hypothetical protein
MLLKNGNPNPPPRVGERPRPEDWREDEPMTLAEAAALLWPRGPITASTLRTAYRQGDLEVAMVARKLLVTRAQVAAMLVRARRIRSAGDGQ